VKVLNASRFVLGRLEGSEGSNEITEPLDLDVLAVLAGVVAEATAAFETFDYARALERTEAFFWRFCDDYLELVKVRAYGADDSRATRSARETLLVALTALLRLLAPFLAFSTEEAWSWFHKTSIHTASWPTPEELVRGTPTEGVFNAVSAVLGTVRRAKSEAQRSMRSEVSSVTVTGSPAMIAAIESARGDLADAGVISSIELREGADDVKVVLADPASG
jgi:valyl-tRNA synthetase